MIDKPPKNEASMSAEAERESLREKVRERLIWLFNRDQKDFYLALGAHADVGDLNDAALVDIIIDNEHVRNAFAEKFDVKTEDLVSPEYIDRETFFAGDERE